MVAVIIVLAVLLVFTIWLSYIYISKLRSLVQDLTKGMREVIDDRDRCAEYIVEHYVRQPVDYPKQKTGVQKINEEQRKEAEAIYNAIKAKRVQSE